MEEGNKSDGDKTAAAGAEGGGESAKRLKTDDDSVERSDREPALLSENSNGSSKGTTSSETALTASSASDSGFPRCRNSKHRNYRKKPVRDDESSNNESANDEEPTVGSELSDAVDDLMDLCYSPPGSVGSSRTIEEGDAAESREDRDDDVEEEEEEDDDEGDCSSATSHLSVIPDSEVESEDEYPVLKKSKPRHKWFIVPEINSRQLGTSCKKQSSELFQRRCYGSLHCVERLELMYKMEQHEGCVNSLNFHPNGELLASGSDDLKVVLWDWKNGRSLMSYDTKHRGNVFQSKFLPLSGDLHIVTCARDGQIRLAQLSAQEGVRSQRKLGSHRGACHKLSVLKDQPQVVISVGEDGLILRHDLRSPKQERLLTVKSENKEHEVALYSISSHPLDGNVFCVAGRDHLVRTYDIRKFSSFQPWCTYHPFKKTNDNYTTSLHVTCAVYNHDGSEILASYNDEDIYLFDVNGLPGQFAHHYQGHRNGATIKGVNFFGPKSEFIVSGSDCGNIYFWERDTEAIVQWLLADDNGVVNCLEPHPQLPFLCTSGLDWDVKVWVPSFEQDPKMTGLSRCVRRNLKTRSIWQASDMDDTQILWMLWRQLSGGREPPRLSTGNSNANQSSDSSSSNDEGHSEQDETDDENTDGPTVCSPS